MRFANRQQGTDTIWYRKAKKETYAEEKRASLGEAVEKGIIMLLVCAVLNSSYRAVGTSSLWSSGRPTPKAVLGMVRKTAVIQLDLQKIFISYIPCLFCIYNTELIYRKDNINKNKRIIKLNKKECLFKQIFFLIFGQFCRFYQLLS